MTVRLMNVLREAEADGWYPELTAIVRKAVEVRAAQKEYYGYRGYDPQERKRLLEASKALERQLDKLLDPCPPVPEQGGLL